MTPTERIGALRNRLKELRSHGTGTNTTLEILIELTEIVAATWESNAQSIEASLDSAATAHKAGRTP